MIETIDWDAAPREKVRPGVERAAFRGDNSILVMNWLSPGMEPRPHSHPFDQVACILRGRMRFIVGDEVLEVGPGSVVRIPAGVQHCGETIGDEVVMNLDVFSPIRTDYMHLVSGQAPGPEGGNA
jgi:quercetin dioxygenase-like cupin family protein